MFPKQGQSDYMDAVDKILPILPATTHKTEMEKKILEIAAGRREKYGEQYFQDLMDQCDTRQDFIAEEAKLLFRKYQKYLQCMRENEDKRQF
jgi:hypothetical protein